MSRQGNYPPELGERAVRMVGEVKGGYRSEWPAITAVASRLGIGSAETPRKWVRRAEINSGVAGLAGLVHHTDAGSQQTSIAFTERLAGIGSAARAGGGCG